MKLPVLSFLILFFFSNNIMAQDVSYELVEPFPQIQITQLLGLETPENDNGYLYALSQQGQIFQIDPNDPDASAEVWLDISGRLVSGGERGLLGLAFHPDFAENGLFYVNYTASSPLRTVVSEFSVGSDEMGDPDSEIILLEFNQPFNNHNGGQISFGPDGFLYIASGDGGSGGDPQGNSQNTQNLLGAMLRIDVDNPDDGLNYGIPSDNPFLNSDDGADEIFAWGLRNPWRFSFDRAEGDLWTGDVGQNAWEAIHIVENGLNYGWAIIEGSNCYPPGSSCDTEGLEMPVFEYDHSEGDRSITGGYVYRGEANPSLDGMYIYGDYISGRIWALDYDKDSGEVISNTELINTPFFISSFGEDANGEIYVLAYNTGRIYRFEAEVETPEIPDSPEITSPMNNETVNPEHQVEWTEVDDADLYSVQIALSEDFETIAFEETLESTSVTVLLDEGTYFVQVNAVNEAGAGEFSNIISYQVESPVSVDPDAELPGEFSITNAYPNPFNPSSQITFDLPESGHVKIEVFSIDGQHVSTLANQRFSSGSHTITFDATGLSSGIYLVRGVHNDTQDVKRITFVK